MTWKLQADSMSQSNSSPKRPYIVVVMGVSGCGKSTVAELVAKELQASFKDGDELHPPINIERMSQGIPLTDQDREPWLHLVKTYAIDSTADGEPCVIACSALKKSYRDILREAGDVWFVHLEGSKELIANRMRSRTGHFMPEALLESQFAALELPTNESQVVSVSIDATVDAVALSAAHTLKAHPVFAKRYTLEAETQNN